MAGKAASGTGTIRKKTVTKGEKAYTYWEARYTTGYDPGTGRQLQRSITGKTQKEVSTKLRAAVAALDAGTYIAPNKQTVGQWLTIWSTDYLGGVKARTASLYRDTIRLYLTPALGAIRLEELSTHTIQAVYNGLTKATKSHGALSPKTVKNIHGILHKALQQAVSIGYLRYNPADPCTLPRIEQKEIKPLDDDTISQFVAKVKGHPLEIIFLTTLFTGLRQGEVLGLQWECIDFERGTITVKQQLQKAPHEQEYSLVETKNGKIRVITPAPSVMALLHRQRASQADMRAYAGECWAESDFVFTDELGISRKPHTVYKAFKAVVRSMGIPATRFHDLRHSYAVAALRAGDDVKTVQANLGHATASFTLDVYGHVTDQMKQESAQRMEQYLKGLSNI